MQDDARERIDTLQIGLTWVNRVGQTVLSSFASRAAAIEAGRQLAAETGREHVVHYATAVRARLAAAAARRAASSAAADVVRMEPVAEVTPPEPPVARSA